MTTILVALPTWMRHAPRQSARAGVEFVARRVPAKLKEKAPQPLHRLAARRKGIAYHPPVGEVAWGDLRRTTPLSREFGYERGQPVDRYYIEQFLARHAGDIHGRVLEIGDNSYTLRFGASRVTRSDILHAPPGAPQATFVADLSRGEHLPSNTFDCIILTQTLHLIYELKPALITLQRILKPGGVLLATVPGISQVSIDEWAERWYWSFTVLSVRRLLAEAFAAENVCVEAHGNVLAAVAFLEGMAAYELRPAELDQRDAFINC